MKAYGVRQVWLQLAVSRFLAWLYWTCTYRYVGTLVRWLLTRASDTSYGKVKALG
jgi:hypothetical protein